LLIGEYQHSVDDKGRLFMPAKFREELGAKFVASRGIGQCLFVFSNDEWTKFSANLTQAPKSNIPAQDFLRLLFASACECEPDKQGRILLPQRLREFAGIEGEAVVIGLMNRAEIWSKQNWDEFNKRSSQDFEKTLENLAALGI
jgi:MraZ protein